jgi:hypothetical protein
MMQPLRFIMCFCLLISIGRVAKADQNVMHGFTFSACGKESCIKVSASTAWLSQLNFGFITEGVTTVQVLTLSGSVRKTFTTTEAKYYPDIDLLSFDQAGGHTVIISLKDESVQVLGDAVPTSRTLLAANDSHKAGKK